MRLPNPPSLGVALLPRDTLAGQVALITGGGTGLGRALSIEFARAGAAVAIASRNPSNIAKGVESVGESGGVAFGVPMDVRRADEVKSAFDRVEAELGGVSILVNNAAANFFSPAEATSPNQWSAVVDRVLTGTFLCSGEFARRRIAARQPGAIVNIVTTSGLLGGPGVAHSGAAKAGVINLTKSLAAEWAQDGISVNAIAPGTFPHGDDPPAVRAGRAGFGPDASRRIPAGRVGEPREVAWLATYLCSPFASFMTGQTITLDGGEHLRRWITAPELTPVRDQIAPRCE